jgi:hypothetical protein
MDDGNAQKSGAAPRLPPYPTPPPTAHPTPVGLLHDPVTHPEVDPYADLHHVTGRHSTTSLLVVWYSAEVEGVECSKSV